jgi:small subunit ribosomal protein S17
MARTLVGIVSSDKANKTIVINIAVRKTHPLYKKQYTVNTKFMAHDEKNEAKVGDKVAVVECRPLSARKRFTLSKVLEQANVRFDEKDATADVTEEEVSEKKK